MPHPPITASAPLTLVASVCLLCAALPGCDNAPPESDAPGRLSFAVVDSLLEAEVIFEATNKALRPPAGFAVVSDSLLSVLRESGINGLPGKSLDASQSADDAPILSAFLDPAHPAGLVAYVVQEADSGDEYAKRYESALREIHRDAEVSAGSYVVNDVFVRNFLVSDTSSVRFHLLCFSDGDDAMRLVYFASRSSYPDLVRVFESSIGTVRVTGKGE